MSKLSDLINAEDGFLVRLDVKTPLMKRNI